GRRSLVEKREAQLDGADENAIPVEDLPTALLLPVDGQLTLGVHLREVEVLAVENDLRVVVGDAVRPDGDVVPASAADRRDLLVDREDLRAPLRLDPLERRHAREHSPPGARTPRSRTAFRWLHDRTTGGPRGAAPPVVGDQLQPIELPQFRHL